MKTLTKITLTAAMMIFLSNGTFATHFTSFRMVISEGKTIEILSKVEAEVEENIPVVHNILWKERMEVVNQPLVLPVKEEKAVEEDIVTVPVDEHRAAPEYLGALVRQLSRPEKEVNDLDFDTREVFENYMADKYFELTPDDLSQFVKEEPEVTEDAAFQSLMQAFSK